MSEPSHGLLLKLPISAYHASEAISHSKVKYFSENYPLAYHHKYIAKDTAPEPPKKAFDVGNAIESLLSYGEKEYATDYPVHPATYPGKESQKKDAATVMKAWNWNATYCQDWREENGGTVISPADDVLVRRMREAVMRNPDARALIEAATPQVTFRSRGANVSVQARSDFWIPGSVKLSDGDSGPVDCDLKSVDSLAPSAYIGFEGQAVDLKYHWASIWYAWVIRRVLAEIAGEPEESLPFVRRMFIVVSKDEFPSCCVYTMPQVLLDLAERDLFGEEPPGVVRRLLACYASGVWPDAPVRKELEIPKWL